VLIDMGATTQDAVLGALSIQLGLPGIRINAYTVDAEAIDALPEKIARRHSAFPISKVGTTLTVAVATPQDLEALAGLHGVEEVKPSSDSTVDLRITGRQEGQARVLEAMIARGLKVITYRPLGSSLEQLYLDRIQESDRL